MSKFRSMTAGLLVGLTLALVAAPTVSAAPPSAVQSGRPLAAQLTGAAEVPAPGDPDGTGVASLRLNQGQQTICYRITVAGIVLPATAAHIHAAPAGVAGPVVVTLGPPAANGIAVGCVSVDASLIKAIRKDPASYYVNVHNADFPAGALRGQLARWAPGQ